MDRRALLTGLSTGVVSLGCGRPTKQDPGLPGAATSDVNSTLLSRAGGATTPKHAPSGTTPPVAQSSTPAFDAFALGAPPWKTFDPFLFCVHHNDAYGQGNATLGPTAALDGRNLGSDFSGRDGWSMYHGETVPGFPRHPHRGFETVTLARRGFIDHSDSLGATARFGQGDVQWMTAGAGVVHAEMFPLVQQATDNPVELFQIWLNLPQKDKFVKPHFAMLWSHTIPRHGVKDAAGRRTELVQMAGAYEGTAAPKPPPYSWASRADSDVAIWTLTMQPNAHFTLPAVGAGTQRTLYFFRGGQARVGGETFTAGNGIRLTPGLALLIENGAEESELLLLQAKPIGEPVVQRGPFVMNTSQEIVQAYRDYRATEFGGWPWQRNDPVHLRTSGRFAIHADGRKETPT